MTTRIPSPEARERIDRLVTDNLGLVQHVVNQVAGRYPRHVDRLDAADRPLVALGATA